MSLTDIDATKHGTSPYILKTTFSSLLQEKSNSTKIKTAASIDFPESQFECIFGEKVAKQSTKHFSHYKFGSIMWRAPINETVRKLVLKSMRYRILYLLRYLQ